jgi:hypothetical protein
MPFGKDLSHLIEEQISKAVEHKNTFTNSIGIASRSGVDEGRIALLEANLQRLADKFTNFLSSQKNNKTSVVDYGLNVIALHGLRLAVTAGRAIFVDRDQPLELQDMYLQLSDAGSARQIRYIYLDSAGVALESTTDPTSIGTGYLPLAMVDVWSGVLEITQDKIKDLRPQAGDAATGNTETNYQLNGNATLYSPDTGNDSFIVSAGEPTGLKVNVSSGKALVDGEVLNAEGGLLDLTNHRNVNKEFIAFSDGVIKTFNLYHQSISNVVVHVEDVVTDVTVDAANGSITFAEAPVQDAKIEVSYTFSGNYMLVFFVEKALTNDGKSYGIITWKVGSNRTAAQPPDLASHQHAIARINMEDSITTITNDLIDNKYEIINLTQQELQFGEKLSGSSLQTGAVSGDKIAEGSIDPAHINLDTAVPDVSNISLNQVYYRQKDGTIVSNIEGNCTMPTFPYLRYAKIKYSVDGGLTWVDITTTMDGHFIVPHIKTGATYLVKIRVVDTVGNLSPGVISAPIYITGKDQPPADVTDFVSTKDETDSTKVVLTWIGVPDVDVKGYEIREGAIWDTGKILATNITGTKWGGTVDVTRQYTFYIKAVDNSNNYSANAQEASILVTVEPSQVANFTVTQIPENRSKVKMSWTANPERDLSYYEIRRGAAWESSTVIATQLKATTFEYRLPGEGNFTFFIKAVNVWAKQSVTAGTVNDTYAIRPTKPSTKSISQDINNRVQINVEWNAVADLDLLQYEVCVGSTWNDNDAIITKETSYQHVANSSGSYTFLIRAKNIAGYTSPLLTMSVQVQVEPSNVAGLSAVQSDADKRLLKFSWNGIADRDIAYYEIRNGAVWDTAVAVTTKINSTFYDYVVATEGTATFLIKAVNKTGFYSTDAAAATTVISLTPSRPNAGSIVSDPDNRLKLKISWDRVSDLDLDYYEVRYGDTVIAQTKETLLSYLVASGGTHNFSVRAKNIAGYYSSVLNLSKTVQAEPASVLTFTVTQSPLDKRILKFAWSAVNDSDLSCYEIRKGSNWDSAAVVGSNIKGVSYEAIATIEETATFLVKSITTAGVGSSNANAATLSITLKPSKPAAGTATLNPNNKATIVLSWTAVADTDFVTYEIRKGTNWDTAAFIATTKENSYSYAVSSSGSYDFLICAKNVAGIYSNPLNVSIVASIEPLDVIGFAATQFINDRSTIRLEWGSVSDKDISYYEIREGDTWDSATLIASRITGLYLDTNINEERIYTYWIKAFNIAGQSSINPAMFVSVFDMNPTKPQTLTLTGDVNDKSNLIINWASISDSDLQEYELRVGIDWESAATIAKTKELRATYKPPASQRYNFMLKAKNVSGFCSDEISTHYDAYIEPASVTNFKAVQNGEYVLMTWDKSQETDVVSYEIREGSVFDNGAALVVTGLSETTYSVKVDTETTKRYHIKAINRAGYYSQAAASVSVAIIELLTKNKVFEYDEITSQSGSYNGTEFGASQYDFSNLGGRFSDYLTTRFSDVGGHIVLKLLATGTNTYEATGEYLVERKDMGRVITAKISAQFVSSVLLATGVTAKLQYRTSRDNVYWSEWQDFKTIQATFRYMDFKAVLGTADPTDTPEINVFKIMIDVPDTDKTGTVTVLPGGSTVYYGYTYWQNPSVIPTAIGAGLRTELISIDKSSFVVRVVNSAGVDVGGTVTWLTRGY